MSSKQLNLSASVDIDRKTISQKLFHFLKLYIPMLITQFALLGGNFVGVFMTGQYSTEHLAGMSVGFNLYSMTYVTMIGIMYGITPIISQLLGAKQYKNIRTIVQHGLYLAAAVSLVLTILGILGIPSFISLMNLSPIAHDVAIKYLCVIGFCVFPFLSVAIMRNTVDSHGYTHYSMAIIFSGFIVNIITNYIFIFGHLGCPALGGVGAALATGAAGWFNMIAYALVLQFKEPFKKYQFFKDWAKFDFVYWRDQLQIGFPVGVAIFCEVSIFALATFSMTMYGSFVIAAHQSAYSFVNLFFSFPLTISLTSTIVVAYEVGRGSFKDAKEYSYVARVLALVIAILFSCFSFTHLEMISSLYTNNPEMVKEISSFMIYALFFTIVDAFGTPIQGILRGYKDVKIITIIAIFCYWGIGIPTAAIFSRLLGFGPYGIWIGLLVGVGSAGVAFMVRVWKQQRKFDIIEAKINQDYKIKA